MSKTAIKRIVGSYKTVGKLRGTATAAFHNIFHRNATDLRAIYFEDSINIRVDNADARHFRRFSSA